MRIWIVLLILLVPTVALAAPTGEWVGTGVASTPDGAEQAYLSVRISDTGQQTISAQITVCARGCFTRLAFGTWEKNYRGYTVRFALDGAHITGVVINGRLRIHLFQTAITEVPRPLPTPYTLSATLY